MMDETLAQEVQMSPEAPEMPLVALSAQDLLNSPPQKLAKGCWGTLGIDMSTGHLRTFCFEMHNPKGSCCTYRFRIHWSIWRLLPRYSNFLATTAGCGWWQKGL